MKRGNNISCESAYAGSGIIRSLSDFRIKNLNGDFDVEAGAGILIDGCDGKLTAKSRIIDIHLDSSVKLASLVADEKVIIRTPGNSNGHKFSFDENAIISVDKSLNYETVDRNSIILLGENTAGHFRKVETMEFAGTINIKAPVVEIKAESWMQKQMNQAKRFGENKKDNKMAEQKGFRFY